MSDNTSGNNEGNPTAEPDQTVWKEYSIESNLKHKIAKVILRDRLEHQISAYYVDTSIVFVKRKGEAYTEGENALRWIWRDTEATWDWIDFMNQQRVRFVLQMCVFCMFVLTLFEIPTLRVTGSCGTACQQGWSTESTNPFGHSAHQVAAALEMFLTTIISIYVVCRLSCVDWPKARQISWPLLELRYVWRGFGGHDVTALGKQLEERTSSELAWLVTIACCCVVGYTRDICYFAEIGISKVNTINGQIEVGGFDSGARVIRCLYLLYFSEKMRDIFFSTFQLMIKIFNMWILIALVFFFWYFLILAVITDGSEEQTEYFPDVREGLWQNFFMLTTTNFPDVLQPLYHTSPASLLLGVCYQTTLFFLLLNILLAIIATDQQDILDSSSELSEGLMRVMMGISFAWLATEGVTAEVEALNSIKRKRSSLQSSDIVLTEEKEKELQELKAQEEQLTSSLRHSISDIKDEEFHVDANPLSERSSVDDEGQHSNGHDETPEQDFGLCFDPVFLELMYFCRGRQTPKYQARMWFYLLDVGQDDCVQHSEFMGLVGVLEAPLELKSKYEDYHFPTIHAMMYVWTIHDWKVFMGWSKHAKDETHASSLDKPAEGTAEAEVGVEGSAVQGDALSPKTKKPTIVLDDAPDKDSEHEDGVKKSSNEVTKKGGWITDIYRQVPVTQRLTAILLAASVFLGIAVDRNDICDSGYTGFEWFSTVLFTIELMLRILAMAQKGDVFAYFKDMGRWLDLAAVALCYSVLFQCANTDTVEDSTRHTYYVNRAIRSAQLMTRLPQLKQTTICVVRVLPCIVPHFLQIFVIVYSFLVIGTGLFAGTVTLAYADGGPGDWSQDRLAPNELSCASPSADGCCAWSGFDMSASYYADLNFDSTIQGFYTLFVLLCQNNWNSIALGYRAAIMYKSPDGSATLGHASQLFFFLYMLFVAIVMINSLIGVFIETHDRIRKDVMGVVDGPLKKKWKRLQKRLEKTKYPDPQIFDEYDGLPSQFLARKSVHPNPHENMVDKDLAFETESDNHFYSELWEISERGKAKAMLSDFSFLGNGDSRRKTAEWKTFAEMIKHLPIAVYIKNRAGKFVYVNPEFAKFMCNVQSERETHEAMRSFIGTYEKDWLHEKTLNDDQGLDFWQKRMFQIRVPTWDDTRGPISWLTKQGKHLGRYELKEFAIPIYGIDPHAIADTEGSVVYLIKYTRAGSAMAGFQKSRGGQQRKTGANPSSSP